jgi:hypothetical protein
MDLKKFDKIKRTWSKLETGQVFIRGSSDFVKKFLAVNAKSTPIAYVYPHFCKHNHSHVEYNDTMIKFDWLVAGILLFPSSAGLINNQICQRKIRKFLQSMRSKGLLPWPMTRKRI